MFAQRAIFAVMTTVCWIGYWSTGWAQSESESPVTRVLFGSCIQQTLPAPIFKVMAEHHPQLLLLLGDNIYADTLNMEEMRAKYDVLAAHADFAPLRKRCRVLATWDDHDYGWNDAGADYAQRDAAQRLFLDFWNVPPASPRRQHTGIYDSAIFGPQGKRLQVILLDTRYFRSPLKRGAKQLGGSYVPDDDPEKTMLGADQWRWLADELRKPADVRLLVSSIQCVSQAAGHETWANLPRERQRLFDLIQETRASGVVILSGDRHWAELSVAATDTPYPIYDLTSSSFNQIHPRGTPTTNAFRALPTTYHRENFGVVNIDWDTKDPSIQLEVRDIQNQPRIQKRVLLSELRPTAADP